MRLAEKHGSYYDMSDYGGKIVPGAIDDVLNNGAVSFTSRTRILYEHLVDPDSSGIQNMITCKKCLLTRAIHT